MKRIFLLLISTFTVFLLLGTPASAAEKSSALAQNFRSPPPSARPWAFWFWMNGNITSNGITADLEAMQRVGIGGVLIMEVARPNTMAPAGPIAFASPQWRGLFQHVVAEARRLGLEVDMNNDAGWCGSGGPWVTPEFSMQKLVSTSVTVRGPQRFEGKLSVPQATHEFYRDIKVLAFPAAAKGKHANVPKKSVLDLSGKMNAEGKLVWDAPAGEWQVLRLGCTTTGAKNKPSPLSGQGLESDKLNPEAIKRHFDAFIAKLADDVGPDAGKIFTMTHIDSWEVGTQDWTPRMAEEFRRRRGYELTPWLAVLAGGATVASAEETERFRWDYKRTQAELNDAAYAGALRELAHRRGLKLSIEAYGGGGFLNPLTYGAEADLPMAEFWIGRWGAWHLLSPRLMASVAHVHNRPIVGAESFTSQPQADSFTEHPYSVKTIGDWAFCEGINRFVFHRNVLHPWTNLAPGMSFSGYGWHVDREQTWWEPGAAFMRYLARCQRMLQEGRFTADICRLVPEGENHGQRPFMAALPNQYDAVPTGYNYDYISDRAVLEELTLKNGQLVTRSGTSYRLLQLPNSKSLTPELTRKLRDLVKAGAVVAGPKPEHSPSLQNFPRCDQEIRTLAMKMWGDCDGVNVKEHKFGAGRAVWGRPMAEVLAELTGGADFAFVLDPPVTDEAIMSVTLGRGVARGKEEDALMPTAGLNWIHRRAEQSEIYFIANPQHREVEALCTFRVHAQQPELWDAATGEIRKPAVYKSTPQGVQLPIHFDPAGSVFVVFRQTADPATQIVEVTRDGALLFGGDRQTPAHLPEIWNDAPQPARLTGEPGRYSVRFANGVNQVIEVAAPPTAVALSGPWNVRFQSRRGAPGQTEFVELIDWSKHSDEGIRHFSGTATYTAQFDWSPVAAGHLRWSLGLGDVKIMAEVKLNGKSLGVLWKPPYAVDVTGALKPGRNDLEVKVTNLWPNRLIGDEQYLDDCTPDGSWKIGPIPAWPPWLLNGQPRPEPRRVTFTTWKYYTANSPLLSSGLLGPVTLVASSEVKVGK